MTDQYDRSISQCQSCPSVHVTESFRSVEGQTEGLTGQVGIVTRSSVTLTGQISQNEIVLDSPAECDRFVCHYDSKTQ